MKQMKMDGEVTRSSSNLNESRAEPTGGGIGKPGLQPWHWAPANSDLHLAGGCCGNMPVALLAAFAKHRVRAPKEAILQGSGIEEVSTELDTERRSSSILFSSAPWTPLAGTGTSVARGLHPACQVKAHQFSRGSSTAVRRETWSQPRN